MAVATGLAVANNYYAQPLLPAIGRDLHLRPGVAGLIVTAAQVGYALGLMFLLPLGDLVERRRLMVLLALGTGAALVWMGVAPNGAVLLPAALAVGAMSVLAQVLVPFSASLAPEHERGRVVGMVMSGLLIGILLARTVAGYLAETGSWRVVYFAAGAAMLAQAVVLQRQLPTWREEPGLTYPRLVASVVALLRREPVLRLRGVYGLLSFGTFSVLWTSVAFLLAHHYRYSTGTIGLFGLAGAAGAVTATAAGRLSDRGGAPRSTLVTNVALVVSWAALWAGGRSVAALVVGIVVLDVGSQGLHITNQGEIYRLHAEARSRLTAAYMVMFFIGGATGSVLSATLYEVWGWNGVCLVGAAYAVASLTVALVVGVGQHQPGRPAPATADALRSPARSPEFSDGG
ncbi:MAG TPA: MFS transporter [Acidimicrobiales bacterium]|nr:MFS transporter [Acidimicrobiales bacterium]